MGDKFQFTTSLNLGIAFQINYGKEKIHENHFTCNC